MSSETIVSGGKLRPLALFTLWRNPAASRGFYTRPRYDTSIQRVRAGRFLLPPIT